MSKPKGYMKTSRSRVRDSSVSASARFLWLLLKSYANPDGSRCYPSTDTLCMDAGHDRKWVFKHLSELEKKHWIVRSKRINGSGFPVNSYAIVDVPCVPKSGTHMRPEKGDTTISHIPADNCDGWPSWCKEADARPGA